MNTKHKPATRSKPIISIMILILFINVTQPTQETTTSTTQTVKSSWLRRPVAIDGEDTDNEWIDTTPHELTLGINKGKSPPYLETKLWVKNDATHLYILMKIIYVQKLNPDPHDQAFIYYLWNQDPAAATWNQSDAAWTHQLHPAEDLCKYDGATWMRDEDNLGQNDAEASGYYDFANYWFEFKKPLSSGEEIDWSMSPGEQFGVNDASDVIFIGFYDESEGVSHERQIRLEVAEEPLYDSQPVGAIDESETVQERLQFKVFDTILVLVALAFLVDDYLTE